MDNGKLDGKVVHLWELSGCHVCNMLELCAHSDRRKHVHTHLAIIDTRARTHTPAPLSYLMFIVLGR